MDAWFLASLLDARNLFSKDSKGLLRGDVYLEDSDPWEKVPCARQVGSGYEVKPLMSA